MKYFIGNLIKGEAATWHFNTAQKIADEFNTWKIHEKLPPHITLYRPFETDKIELIRKFLASWAGNNVIPGNFALSGFGHFHNRVVYGKVDAEKSTTDAVIGLREELKKIPALPPEDFPDWRPHATLANHLEPEKIKLIWEYTAKLEKPNFIIPFDNVTIFRYEGDKKYVVEESFPLKS